MENVGRVMALMEEVEKLGEAGVGRFVPYNTSNRSNGFLVDRYGNDPKWAWIGTLGGYMRIAEKGTPISKAMATMKPGEWIDGGPKTKLHGFGGSDHAIHGAIKVRLSREAVESSFRCQMPSVAGNYTGEPGERRGSRRPRRADPPAPPAAPDPEVDRRLAELQIAVRKVYSGMGIAVPKATEDWLAVAGEKDMESWLSKAGKTGGNGGVK